MKSASVSAIRGKRLLLSGLLGFLLLLGTGIYLIVVSSSAAVSSSTSSSALSDGVWRPAAFMNPGSACYRNAALQVLFRLSGVDFCLARLPDRPQPLLTALCRVQSQIDTKSLLDLADISAQLPAPFSNVYAQQDADEFLIALNAQLAREAEDVVRPMLAFGVRVTQRTLCQAGQTTEVEDQNESPMQLMLEDGHPADEKTMIDIVQLLREISETSATVNCDCDNCIIQNAGIDRRTLDREYTGFPHIAKIQLPRFTGYGTETPKRVQNLIEAPLVNLRLRPNFAGPQPNYRLVGVVEIYGRTPKSGHYAAKVLIKGQWWYLNDSVLPALIEPNQVITKDAYILFYETMATV